MIRRIKVSSQVIDFIIDSNKERRQHIDINKNKPSLVLGPGPGSSETMKKPHIL